MNTSEAAKRWGITPRRIGILCSEGRIPGAYKERSRWRIPVDAEKPADQRSGKARVREDAPGKLPLPVDVLLKLSDLYGVSVDYLLGRTDERTPYPKSRHQ